MDPWGGLLKCTSMAWFLLVKKAHVRWGALKRLFMDGFNLLMQHERLLGAWWLLFVAEMWSRPHLLQRPPVRRPMELQLHLLDARRRARS